MPALNAPYGWFFFTVSGPVLALKPEKANAHSGKN
jgi:hypothetical protein